MGATPITMAVTDAHVDHANRILTTPAYMCDTGPHGVFTGVGKMVDALAALLR
jgi:enhancing lycopene biosynthesis protein 2